MGVIRRRIDNTMINVASGKQQGSQMVMNKHIYYNTNTNSISRAVPISTRQLYFFSTREDNQLNYLLLIDISSAVRVAQSSA